MLPFIYKICGATFIAKSKQPPLLSDTHRYVFIDFLLTVKEATLIFISGRGWAISSAKEGNHVLFIAFWAQTCVHFMKILTIYTLNSYLLTLKAHNHKMYVFLSSTKIFEAS